jgi:hypothetical protein
MQAVFEPIGYQLPFSEGVQEIIDTSTGYRRAPDLSCPECRQSYFIMLPEVINEDVPGAIAALGTHLDDCQRHPDPLK